MQRFESARRLFFATRNVRA